MGLTNSVEEINESDIQITNDGEYNSWDDITKDLTDEKMKALMEPVESSTDTTSEESVDEELRENVTKFVDEVIEKAVSEYNKLKMAEEDAFFRIPSNDDLYEKSLEKHFENTYEYHDEMRVRESSESVSEYEESSDYEESSGLEEVTLSRRGCKNTLYDLCEACMEFCDEMNGHYDDYSEDEEMTFGEYYHDWVNSPDMLELRENIYSLKTSYELVRDRMNEFIYNNRKTLKTGMYGALFYYIFFSKRVN